MKSEKMWYALYTRPRWEKKVADLLSRRKIENFCPLNKVMRQWSDRKKIVYEPLFSSYVFVRASEIEHLAIKQTDGVLNFVYWLNKPAIIKDEEIDAIKDFLSNHHDVKLEKIKVNVADKVRVTSGPLMALEGEVIEIKSKTVKVFLPSLGYALYAELEKSNVEVVNLGASTYKSSITYNAKFS